MGVALLSNLQLSGPICSYQDIEEAWTEYDTREHWNRSFITLCILMRFKEKEFET